MNLDFGVNSVLIDDQYRRYLDNPDSVDEEWRVFFEDLAQGQGSKGIALPARALHNPEYDGSETPVAPSSYSELAWNVMRLISQYRSRGHYYATIDPLGINNEVPTDLSPELFGISERDLDARVPSVSMMNQYKNATVRDILNHMSRTYCGSIGYEIYHIEDHEEREWLTERIESPEQEVFDADFARWALKHLTDAQELERFLHTQYIGAKRFSLEGLDSVIPMLHRLLDLAGDNGVRESVIGMAHRGRLNVLINIMKKGFEELFTEFDDRESTDLIGRGDVKYHLGYLHWRKSPRGSEVRVSLCFNPSHLEFVDPVVVGRVRARIDKNKKGAGIALPIMIHGDSAFMGQGVVFETLNLAELEGYDTGGTIHVVMNNQVGFTTTPSNARSSRYASDAIRFLRVPVFHVNADDIPAVMRATRLAFEYRQRFQRDVCIDLVGYRKYGHNEGDEPRFTQPIMYHQIDERDSVRDAFAKQLIQEGVITEAESDQMVEDIRAEMHQARTEAKSRKWEMPYVDDPTWAGYVGGPESKVADVQTGVPSKRLKSVLAAITTIPDGVDAHPKIQALYEKRAQVFDEPNQIDWGTAEALAYGTLANEGHHVRLTGQDSRRGTFAHRHSYAIDQRDNSYHNMFNQAADKGGWFQAFDSPLSETAVLGFEYGYSLEAPNGLTIWEAQFGDFANGAQVIIDQFISAGEDKWRSLSGVVMLLPHGFEGMGPEHSYARLGRFLELAAEDNMQICDATTPAQFFHLLRRQVVRPWRTPLVVMTPKSLLRSRDCRSSLEDLTSGTFRRILPDVSDIPPEKVRRVLLCSGRIYYDLANARKKEGVDDVHIIRFEQLYPLHGAEIAEVLTPYQAGTELVWVQDEPWNMGAWYFIKVRLQAIFGDGMPIQCVSRSESASPATGSNYAHRLENKALMEAALGISRASDE